MLIKGICFYKKKFSKGLGIKSPNVRAIYLVWMVWMSMDGSNQGIFSIRMHRIFKKLFLG